MDTFTIKKLLKKFRCFKGVFPCDKLPYYAELPLNIIINTDPSHKPGQHWVAVSIDKRGRGYYFDSFGFPPITYQILKFLHKKAPKGFEHNEKQIQDISSTTCGNYCVLFIIFKCSNLTPAQYLKHFGSVTLANEAKIKMIFRDFSLVQKIVKR